LIRRRRPDRDQLVRIGDREFLTRGLDPSFWTDAFHNSMSVSWPVFFAGFGLYFVVMNLIFASLYWLGGDSIANARAGSLTDLFFFSIETLATVGYGYMNPATLYGHVVASTEIMTGMLGIAIITGLMFARFARPPARVLFSECAVVAPFEGVPTLMVRAANERNNLILEAAVRATLVRRERTPEGEVFYRMHELKLERERSGAFALSWTILHKIDAASPLCGQSAADLEAAAARLSVSISGYDDTLNDLVHARHEYGARQIVFGARFVDFIS
jgi:inward rectifier potassium channel